MRFSIALLLLATTLLSPLPTAAQLYSSGSSTEVVDDDLNPGGDIFTDFSEDLESNQILEDERFYRYGRFFSFHISVGMTSFDGNRGAAYDNRPPTLGLSLHQFMDFSSSFSMGFTISKHSMFLGVPTHGFDTNAVGMIDINILRVFWGYNYYIDTSDLGTAFTFSNPRIIGRLEYWYLRNSYIDQTLLDKNSESGLGFAFGVGLEFPIRMRETYLGLEFLAHFVGLSDKNTTSFREINNSGIGYDDLSGNVYTTMLSYIFNW
ncbi:MAG: hypothetical protein HN353_01035 [Bdellovibrionales bacterium]|nr:hypothetical protein [Bdellovibrionales bacterium]MBT3526746.1 hypothetical protein [Bdellovibrionales bacterium]MBT7767110.1 hypothetical protein [Bdellovibrionales bacterium]